MDRGGVAWVVIAVIAVMALLVVLALFPEAVARSLEDFASFAHVWIASIVLAIILILEIHDTVVKGRKDKVFWIVCKSLLQYAAIQGIIYLIEMFVVVMKWLLNKLQQILPGREAHDKETTLPR